MTTIPVDATEITPAWLTEVLGHQVSAIEVQTVGTGQMGVCHRVALTGDDGLPPTVLIKMPSADPAMRDLVAGVYRSELRFYTDIAPTVAIRVPEVLHADMAPVGGLFVLVMEDLAPRVQGDQVVGCSVDQLRDAVVNLAGLHGPRWQDPTLLDIEGLDPIGEADADLMVEIFPSAIETLVDNLGDRLEAADVETLRAGTSVIRTWILARPERWGLLHGDYRLDNLMFPPTGAEGVVTVDWQTLSFALPARDLAFLVSTGVDPEVRRLAEGDLVGAYHEALLGHGVTGYSLDDCWDDYRLAMLHGPLTEAFGFAYGARTDRGDEMFAVITARSCQAIRDLETLTHPALG